jgi:hypothetical protein
MSPHRGAHVQRQGVVARRLLGKPAVLGKVQLVSSTKERRYCDRLHLRFGSRLSNWQKNRMPAGQIALNSKHSNCRRFWSLEHAEAYMETIEDEGPWTSTGRRIAPLRRAVFCNAQRSGGQERQHGGLVSGCPQAPLHCHWISHSRYGRRLACVLIPEGSCRYQVSRPLFRRDVPNCASCTFSYRRSSEMLPDWLALHCGRLPFGDSVCEEQAKKTPPNVQ